jgi:glycosyltransferase involved in cell wall biosynthesis
MKIALCILTRNELDCVQIIYPQLAALNSPGYDSLYVIDGGSTDGTVEYFQEKGIPILSQSKRGRGEAFQMAFQQIDADAYLFFSPDGNEDIKDLHRFREELQKGADIVIASRMMKGAVNEEDHLTFKWRKWANNAFNIVANLFYRRSGKFITDSINGYRAITKAAAEKLQLDAYDYTIEYQMTIRGFKNKLHIVEFPTIEGQRVAGGTGAPSFQTGVRFIKRFFAELTA